MRKQIVKGILTAAMVAMTTTPVMAQDFSAGKTRVDVSVTTASTEDTATYDVTVPTILALTVDASGETPKVLIGSSDGQTMDGDNTVGTLVFKNNSRESKNGSTKELGVALKTMHITQAEGSCWTVADEVSSESAPYSMSFAFGEDGKVKPQSIDGLPYSMVIFNDFVMGQNNSTKELKVRANAGGTKEGYENKDAAAAFYMEYWFRTTADAEYAVN